MTEDTDDIVLEEEADAEESIIPEEDFREAIAVCRQDPQLNRYFEMAPPGAKLFIGLGFYSTHFGDKVDPRQYAECQSEIEPSLTPNDLKYLIRFERDKNTKQYLRELLAQREAEETAAEEAPAATPDATPSLPKRKRRRKIPKADLQAEAASEEQDAGIPIPFKIAAIVALLLGGAFVLYVATRPSAPQPAVRQQAEATPTGSIEPTQDDAPPSAARRVNKPKPPQRSRGTYALIDADEEDARLHGADTPFGMEEVAALAPAETNATSMTVAENRKRATRKPRVVFTDGKKIVKRPGGQIEVPRVFSCAGAGVKPFWVYGAHPEADAAQEKKARDEWQALVRQARQAEEEVPGANASAKSDVNML